MLDLMRKKVKDWSWILWLVILSFIATIFFVWGIGDDPSLGGNVVATVNGEKIPREQYYNALRNLTDFYRSRFGEQFENFRDSLDLETQALDSLIEETLLQQQAQELGLTASDHAVLTQIATIPAFQKDGHFNSDLYYERLKLAGQSYVAFEEGIRAQLMTQELRQIVGDATVVFEEEIINLYKTRTDSLSLESMMLQSRDFEDGVTVVDEEIEAYFTEHADEFQVPETIQVDYLFADTAQTTQAIEVTTEEVEAYYQRNRESLYKEPEQVKARHILFSLEPEAAEEEEQAARQRAQETFDELTAGRDFAEAASELTEDPSGKSNGGDLGWFGPERMVPEFSEKAFSLQPGEISEPVRTQFGYHLILVEEKKEAGYQALDDVRESIRASIRKSRAEEQARKKIETSRLDLLAGQSPIDAAETQGIAGGQTPFFRRGAEIPGLGREPNVSSEAFELTQGRVSNILNGARGLYVVRLVERRPPHVGTLEEVRDEVERAVKQQKALELAKEKAQTVREQLESTPWQRVAEETELTVQKSEDYRRGRFLPSAGQLSEDVQALLFQAKANEVFGPIELDRGVAFIRVLENKPADLAELDEARDGLREELQQQKQNALFADWLDQVRIRSKIERYN